MIVLQVGGWCLKTSGRRCHSDGEAARAAALAIARLKRGLGTLLPDDTAVAVVEDGRRQWVWTISPWLRTLRAELADAAARGDETCLATALVAFADGAVHSLQLADAAALVLDVHPSNFARQGGRIVYLDDDVGSGSILHAIGHAVLQRVEEYGEHADACETYVKAFESRLQSVLGARQVARLELRRVFEACRMRTEIAGWARDRILRTLWRCR